MQETGSIYLQKKKHKNDTGEKATILQIEDVSIQKFNGTKRWDNTINYQ
jgi:hypothetical protein